MNSYERERESQLIPRFLSEVNRLIGTSFTWVSNNLVGGTDLKEGRENDGYSFECVKNYLQNTLVEMSRAQESNLGWR